MFLQKRLSYILYIFSSKYIYIYIYIILYYIHVYNKVHICYIVHCNIGMCYYAYVDVFIADLLCTIYVLVMDMHCIQCTLHIRYTMSVQYTMYSVQCLS